MNRGWILASAVIVVMLFAQPARGQSKPLWPELDLYVKINAKVRLLFSAARTNENGEITEADFGASIDYSTKPLLKLTKSRGDHQDTSKSQLLTFRAGYHFLPSRQGPAETRIALDGTARLPLNAGLVASGRQRAELRFISGQFSWRYRNRPGIERNFAIRSYDITPYAQAEFYYDGAYHKWSRTALIVGCVFPIRKRSEIETYFEHQNRTETSPNKRLNAIGIQLNYYF
jgi:hypothetical protein